MGAAWTPMYWADYMADTGHLSLAEHGAYLMLMAHYYSTRRPLPASAMQLHRICRAFADAEQRAVDAVVSQFFYLEDGCYKHKRIEQELKKAAQLAEKRSYAANSRWEREQSKRNASALQTDTQSQPQLQVKEKTISEANASSCQQQAARHVNGVNGSGKSYLAAAERIIEFLNSKVGRNFQARSPDGKATAGADKVIGLLRKGYGEQDIKTVIARKSRDWTRPENRDRMEAFLRPETLFRRSKFESYFGECVSHDT